MGFFKRISSIFASESKKDENKKIRWSAQYENEKIILTADRDLSESEQISDLINMYNIERAGKSLLFRHEEIYDLYYDENQIEIESYKWFGLPDLFKGFLKIENKNNFLQDEEVIYRFEFEGFSGRYEVAKGNILKMPLSEEYRVIPKTIYDVIKKLRDYNNDEKKRKDVSEQFEMLRFIKEYSKEVDLILNKRLRDEETPIVIDKITIDFRDDGETLELFPVLSEDESINRELLGKIYSYGQTKDFYSADVDGKRVKFVIKNKETMDGVIKNRFNKEGKRLDILKGNNEIFDDENVDLSLFGPRVTGIGYLNYRSYSMTSNTSDIEWFESDMQYPYFMADSEKIKLTPEDKIIFEAALNDMNVNGNEMTEMAFKTDGGEEVKLVLTKDDIKNEIQKINASIKGPSDITSKSVLDNILKNYESHKDKAYIEYNGKYIKNYSEEAFREQLKQLESLQRDDKSSVKEKEESLLIAENLDAPEYNENGEDDVQIADIEIPTALKESIQLFDYQKEALHKLQNLYLSSNLNGFLLCDDMGLGKTLQLLSFLAWLKDKDKLKPSLVVAPTSLLNNWDNENGSGEVQKFFENGCFETEKVRGRLDEEDVERLKHKDIVFTTYDTLRMNNIKLGTIKWNCMICDEAQKIKNPKTLVTVAAKGQNANFKVICSATPIENSLVDLWNLVDYSKPGLLGSLKDFQGEYIKRIEKASDDELKLINDELYGKIKQFYIRREKDILPESLPNKKIKIYKKKANSHELDILGRIQETDENRLAAIQKMIIACSHIDLISESNVNLSSVQELVEKSTKLKITQEILKEIKAGDEKVIIFTRSLKMQQILYKVIKNDLGVAPKIVNGDISDLDKRTRIIDEFRNTTGFDVIILSPDVAGFGITLTEANHVIHYTRLWNPAKEDQATDRAYRIGQDKDVTVHYPMVSFAEEGIAEYSSAKDYVDANMEIPAYSMSPEEKLNILLARKKNMLLNFFLAVDKGDLSENDFFKMDDKKDRGFSFISVDDIDKGIVDEFEFEALIGVLYAKMGYETFVTTRSSDNGVDVICKKDEELIFVQCKKTQKLNGSSAIKDLLFARDIYQKETSVENVELVVATNSKELPKAIVQNDTVEVLDGHGLDELLRKYAIYKDEVDIKNANRYSLENLKYELK